MSSIGMLECEQDSMPCEISKIFSIFLIGQAKTQTNSGAERFLQCLNVRYTHIESECTRGNAFAIDSKARSTLEAAKGL